MKSLKFYLLITVLLIPFLSFSQEYEIKANVAVAFSKECLDLVVTTVSNNDRQGFAKLQDNGCISIPGDKGQGLSGIRVIKVKGYLTYSKFYLKGYPTSYVWILNDQVVKVE